MNRITIVSLVLALLLPLLACSDGDRPTPYPLSLLRADSMAP